MEGSLSLLLSLSLLVLSLITPRLDLGNTATAEEAPLTFGTTLGEEAATLGGTLTTLATLADNFALGFDFGSMTTRGIEKFGTESEDTISAVERKTEKCGDYANTKRHRLNAMYQRNLDRNKNQSEISLRMESTSGISANVRTNSKAWL